MAGGLWGVSPHETKRGGRVAHPCNPATSGAQATGEPSATGVGKGGPGRQSPHGGGFGGCAPTIPKRGEVANPRNLATSGTQNAGKP
jgi:hypothetical protein